MDHRAVIVALTVVAAGCSGIGATNDSQQPGVTVTPAPVPAPRQGANEISPGLTADSVVDVAALADAHARALNTSFTVHGRQTVHHWNGSLLAHRDMRMRLNETHSRFHIALGVAGPGAIRLLGEPPARIEVWTSGDRSLRAYKSENTTTVYNEIDRSVAAGGLLIGSWTYWFSVVLPGGQPWSDIRPLFIAFAPQPVPQQDGQPYALTARTLDRPDVLASNDNVHDPYAARFDAVIDENGLVREYQLEYRAVVDGAGVRVTRTVRYTHVGQTTVDRPAWYDKAIAEPNTTALR